MSALVQCGGPVIARTALPYRRSSNGATSQARHRALARLAREEDLVGEPLLDDLAVEGRALQELVVRAMVQQSPALEHRDLVGERDRRQPMGDDERRAAGPDLCKRALDLLLG